MPVANDIFMRLEVEVVIFTVVEHATLQKLSGLGLISPEPELLGDSAGLSLFVVTLQGEGDRILPGDAILPDESIERAARRIADERLGISLKSKLRALKAFDDPKRGNDQRVISFPFWGLVNFEDLKQYLGGRDRVGLELVSSQAVMADFDAKAGLEKYDGVSRFGYRVMPNAKLGIPHAKHLTSEIASGRILANDHDDMVFYSWRELRHAFDSKLDPFNYLSINPLGDEFRISDLQEFQEVCRGEIVSRDAFRRTMMKEESYLRKTMQIDSSASRPGKPANLYSLAQPPVGDDSSS